jgi:putative DNA primase/helicase
MNDATSRPRSKDIPPRMHLRQRGLLKTLDDLFEEALAGNRAIKSGAIVYPDASDDLYEMVRASGMNRSFSGDEISDTICAGLKGETQARSRTPEGDDLPPGYSMINHGLVWRDPWRDPSDKEKAEVWLASPFKVRAETRDGDGKSWGVLLEWADRDGRQHHLSLPRSMLAGDGIDARRALLDGGLHIASSPFARARFTAFLNAVRSPLRRTATSRIGWHGTAFVFPDQCVGASFGQELFLQDIGAVEHAFRQSGTLQEWQHEIARPAVGNSRMVLALSTAFAAPLIGPCEAESGGQHFRGPSSIGKTTALEAAGSACGGGNRGGVYVDTWRATANGLEGVALGHCDSLL